MDMRSARKQYEQGEALKAAGVPQALVRLLGYARYDAERATEVLLGAAASVEDRCARIIKTVDEGRSINELGELQGSALSVDVACGRYDMAQKNLDSVRKAVTEVLINIVTENGTVKMTAEQSELVIGI